MLIYVLSLSVRCTAFWCLLLLTNQFESFHVWKLFGGIFLRITILSCHFNKKNNQDNQRLSQTLDKVLEDANVTGLAPPIINQKLSLAKWMKLLSNDFFLFFFTCKVVPRHALKAKARVWWRYGVRILRIPRQL